MGLHLWHFAIWAHHGRRRSEASTATAACRGTSNGHDAMVLGWDPTDEFGVRVQILRPCQAHWISLNPNFWWSCREPSNSLGYPNFVIQLLNRQRNDSTIVQWRGSKSSKFGDIGTLAVYFQIWDCSTALYREQRAMALLGLGRQSAIDLALDEWAAVAEAAGVIATHGNGNHTTYFISYFWWFGGWFIYDIVLPTLGAFSLKSLGTTRLSDFVDVCVLLPLWWHVYNRYNSSWVTVQYQPWNKTSVA